MSATQPTPHRVQLRRTKGWRKPPNTVSVARPTKWGNPFRVATGCQSNPEWSRSMVVALFRNDLRSAIEDPWGKSQSIEVRVIAESIEELRGKNLACWCPLDQPCHADVLLEMANSGTTNRPTLYDVATRLDAVHQDHPQAYAAVDMLDYLTEHGYVIVHPDDVPTENDGGDHDWTWNGCRAHIFGDDQ